MTAPVTTRPATGLPPEVLAAHLLTQRALELAGKRLLSRSLRGTYTGDLRALHTHVPVRADQLPRLLAGALDWADETAAHVGLQPAGLRAALTDYVGGLLLSGRAHSVAALPAVLSRVPRR